MNALRFFVLGFGLTTALHADLTVQAEMKSPESPEITHTQMSFGRGHMRTELSDGANAGGGMILKVAERKMIVLMPQQKQYMIRSIPVSQAPVTEPDKLPD